MRTYIYPENLKQKATLWLWQLRDVVILGVGILLSVFVFTQFRTLFPFSLVAAFAFLSMRFDDMSLLDYILYATRFFLSAQQTFYWRLES